MVTKTHAYLALVEGPGHERDDGRVERDGERGEQGGGGADPRDRAVPRARQVRAVHRVLTVHAQAHARRAGPRGSADTGPVYCCSTGDKEWFSHR